jgi:hypothetical protein
VRWLGSVGTALTQRLFSAHSHTKAPQVCGERRELGGSRRPVEGPGPASQGPYAGPGRLFILMTGSEDSGDTAIVACASLGHDHMKYMTSNHAYIASFVYDTSDQPRPPKLYRRVRCVTQPRRILQGQRRGLPHTIDIWLDDGV